MADSPHGVENTGVAIDHKPFSDRTNGKIAEEAELAKGYRDQKTREIWAEWNGDRDIAKLSDLATSCDGLMTDEIRRCIWPILLNCPTKPQGSEDDKDWTVLPYHRDEEQVQLDVNRSFVFYPPYQNDIELQKSRSQLYNAIIEVLRSHPALCYFQGYHDIAQVLLLVFQKQSPVQAIAHLSLLRIRDFMLPSLSPSIAHLELLSPILRAVDHDLHAHLADTRPFFALSATLTLYAHDIQSYSDIARLFDFLIAQPAVVAVYFFATIIRSRRKELFEVPADEPEILHSVLSKLPGSLDLEELIADTMTLFTHHPPERLHGLTWWRVSAYSVLKTTRWPLEKRDLAQGERLFAQQSIQLQREEVRKRAMKIIWHYRRPAGRIGAAMFIGILAIWLRNHGMTGSLGPAFWKGIDIVRTSFRSIAR